MSEEHARLFHFNYSASQKTVTLKHIYRQNCCASSRIYVHSSIYETFISKLVERARKNVAGDPFDKQTFMGPQIDGRQHARIMAMIERARTQGAKLATGGGSPGGWFVEPTVFRDVEQGMEVMREEVFGPVVAVAPFSTVDEVMDMAHDTCYGLAAALFTQNMSTGLRVAKDLEAGTIWVNSYGAISHALPFGGFRQSGSGKDLGSEALDEFTQTKTVRVNLSD